MFIEKSHPLIRAAVALSGGVHGQPGEIESTWDSGLDGSFGFSHMGVGEGGGLGDDVQPGHVHAHIFAAVVVDGPVAVIGGKDVEVVELLGFGHGGLASSARLDGGAAVVEGTVNTLVGEGHHWQHAPEVKAEITVVIDFVLLSGALLAHFVGEGGVSLDLIPLSGESSHVEVVNDGDIWASTETHSSFGSKKGGGGEGKYCFHLISLSRKNKL